MTLDLSPIGAYELTRFSRYLARDTGVKEYRFFRTFMLIIESAMIYSTAILVEIVLYFSGNNAFYIIYDPIAQLTVSPYLICFLLPRPGIPLHTSPNDIDSLRAICVQGIVPKEQSRAGVSESGRTRDNASESERRDGATR